MPEIRKIYAKRLADPSSPGDPAAIDLDIFDLSITQARGQAARLSMRIRYPQDGFLQQRYVAVSVDIDGVVNTVAVAEIADFPLGLIGETVTIRGTCRPPDLSDRIDAAWEKLSAIVPEYIERSDTPRRAEPFFPLEPVVSPWAWPFQDGVNMRSIAVGDLNVGEEEFIIAGRLSADDPRAPVDTSGNPENTIYSLSAEVSLIEPPISHVDVQVSCDFEQLAVRIFDLYPSIETEAGGREEILTYTPDALENALGNSSTGTGGEYRLLGAWVKLEELTSIEPRRVYSKAPETDDFTCIKTKGDYTEFPLFGVVDESPSDSRGAFPLLARHSQTRREIMQFRIDLNVPEGFPTRSERLSMDIEQPKITTHSGTDFYRPSPDGAARSATFDYFGADTLFVDMNMEQPQYRFALESLLRLAASRAQKLALEANYCMELSVEVPAAEFLSIAGTDCILKPVVAFDERLPGSGLVLGYVDGWEVAFSSQRQSAKVQMRFAPVGPDASSPGSSLRFDPAGIAAGSGLDFEQFGSAATVMDIGFLVQDVEGLIENFTASGINAGDISIVLDSIDITNLAAAQESSMPTDPETPVPDPERAVPKTDISVSLKDIGSDRTVSEDTCKVKLESGAINIAGGVAV